MMIERLSFARTTAYSAIEAAIHLCRYSLAQTLCAGKRVLDISCGEGYGSSFLATKWGAAEVHGVDISEEAIGRARETFADARITFHCRPAEQLDDLFAAASFDLIVCLETMEHMPDARRLLTSLRRLLKPGGTLILSCPNDWWYYPQEGQGNPYHLRKYTHAEFVALAQEVLGPPAQQLLGMPVAGFANVVVGDAVLTKGAGDDSQLGMFRMRPGGDAAVLPADDDITPKNCSYFVGVWGTPVPSAMFTVFPCSMDRSAMAHEQQAVNDLRREVARIERALRDSQLVAAAWRAECEYMRAVAVGLRGAPPPSGRRTAKDLAYAAYTRLRRVFRRG
jgi:2-polyprenyl-3-methyl-5-hydroxy-6-metoxy-1,4-benzoquinol methylase